MRPKIRLRKEHFRAIMCDRLPSGIWTVGGREEPCPRGMPDRVNVYGKHFKIRYHTKIYMDRRASSQLAGVVVFEPRTIFIDPSAPLHVLRQTLCHEILHIYFRGSELDPKLEEKLCDTLGFGLLDLSSNNLDLLLTIAR